MVVIADVPLVDRTPSLVRYFTLRRTGRKVIGVSGQDLSRFLYSSSKMDRVRDMLTDFVAALDAPDDPIPPPAAAVDLLGIGPARWAVALTQRCTERMVATLPPERVAVLAPLIATATEFTVVQLVVALRGDGVTAELSPDQRLIVARLADNDDDPFRDMVVALRGMQHVCADDLIERADAWPSPQRQQLVRIIADQVAAFVDQTIDRLIVFFLAERERSLARRLTDRRAIVSALVRGESFDPDAARQSLGVNLNGHHLGLVCWPTEPGSVTSATERARELERAARRIADLLRCPSMLTLAVDDGLWAWAVRETPFRSAEIESIRTPAVSVAVAASIAAGNPGHGPVGFRRTHLTALATRRVIELTGSDAAVTLHRDVPLLAVLLVDPERAAWYVEEQLGPLARGGAAQATLRATVLAYLDCGMSLVAAAQQLHVHRNTVVYRLRRAEAQLGHPLTQRPQELHAAVLLAEKGIGGTAGPLLHGS